MRVAQWVSLHLCISVADSTVFADDLNRGGPLKENTCCLNSTCCEIVGWMFLLSQLCSYDASEHVWLLIEILDFIPPQQLTEKSTPLNYQKKNQSSSLQDYTICKTLQIEAEIFCHLFCSPAKKLPTKKSPTKPSCPNGIPATLPGAKAGNITVNAPGWELKISTLGLGSCFVFSPNLVYVLDLYPPPRMQSWQMKV